MGGQNVNSMPCIFYDNTLKFYSQKYQRSQFHDLEFPNELIKILNHISNKYENLLLICDIAMSIENVYSLGHTLATF